MIGFKKRCVTRSFGIRTVSIALLIMASIYYLEVTTSLMIGAVSPVQAQIVGNGTNARLLYRVGSNNLSGAPDTVIYNAGVPSALSGLPGVTTQGTTQSVNNIQGAAGGYTVRIITRVNAITRPRSVPVFNPPPYTGTFTFDSTGVSLDCVSGGCSDSLSIGKISWVTQRNRYAAGSYNGSDQVISVQTDNDGRRGRVSQISDRLRFFYDNSELVPAGTYEAVIQNRVSDDF